MKAVRFSRRNFQNLEHDADRSFESSSSGSVKPLVLSWSTQANRPSSRAFFVCLCVVRILPQGLCSHIL